MFKIFQKHKKSVIYTWALSYMIILIVPLIWGLAVYSIVTCTLRNETISYSETFLWQFELNLEQTMRHVNNINAQLSANHLVINMLNQNGQPDNYWYSNTKMLSQELNDFKLSTLNIEEVMLYFPKMDFCVTSKYSMPSSEFFYRLYKTNDNDKYANWKAHLTSSSNSMQYAQDLTFDVGTPQKYVEFIQSYPLLSKSMDVISVAYIKSDNLTSLKGYDMDKYNAVFVALNSHDDVIFHSHDTKIDLSSLPRDSGITKVHKNYVISSYLPSIGWRIYSILIPEYYLKSLNQVKVVTVILFIVYACIGLFLTTKNIRKNYAPIQALMSKIDLQTHMHDDNNSNEYYAIESAFNEIIDSNKKINIRFEHQSALLRDKFISELLKLPDIKNKAEKYNQYNLEFPAQKFVVAIFTIDDPDEIFREDNISIERRRQLGNYIILNIISEMLNEKYYSLLAETDMSVAAIINTDVENVYDGMKKIISKAQSFIFDNFDFSFTASISAIHVSDIGIHDAYTEAAEAMEYKMLYDAQAIIFYKDINTFNTSHYYYPPEKEQQLIGYITSGNAQEANTLINEIYEMNFKNQFCPITLIKCLIFDIASSILKAMDNMFDSTKNSFKENIDMLEDFTKANTIYEMQNSISNLIEKVCRRVRMNNNRQIDQNVIEFIKENYSSNQLTVASIAEYLNLNPTYLSSAFKSKTGCTPLEFIMQWRIKKSKELLNTGAYSLDEISQMVGYDNRRTFTRIFKKLEGVTPSDYLKNN